MSLTVFRHALRQVRRSLVILPLSSAAFYYLVLFSSSSFVRAQPESPFLRRPPEVTEAFLGGSVDFLAPAGWLAAAMTHPITLALLVAAALAIAAGAVATEVERGTVDLLLVRPVGRRRFLLAKAAASVMAVTLAELGGVVGVLVARGTVTRVGEIGLWDMSRAFLDSWILFAALAMVGLLVSARSSLRGRAIGLSVGVIVAWFFMRFIALLIDEVSPMRFASPFQYFRPTDVLGGERFVWDLLVLAALGLACLATSMWWFSQRDLTR